MPIFRVKSLKIYTGQKKFTRASLVGLWQISGMGPLWRSAIICVRNMLSCSILRLNLCCFMMSKKWGGNNRNDKEFQSRHPPSHWLYLSLLQSLHCLCLSYGICLCLNLCICATSRLSSPSHGYSCHLPSRTLCGCLSPCQQWIKWRTMKDSRCDGEPCIIAHGQLTSWIKGRLSL